MGVFSNGLPPFVQAVALWVIFPWISFGSLECSCYMNFVWILGVFAGWERMPVSFKRSSCLCGACSSLRAVCGKLAPPQPQRRRNTRQLASAALVLLKSRCWWECRHLTGGGASELPTASGSPPSCSSCLHTGPRGTLWRFCAKSFPVSLSGC